jgi:hypothetical protein
MALDGAGLQYQVLDVDGGVRETLSWPIRHPRQNKLLLLPQGKSRVPCQFPGGDEQCIQLHFSGRAAAGVSGIQTLLSTPGDGEMPPLWIGLRGQEQRLTVIINRDPGRSPHYWCGPKVEPGQFFAIDLMLHRGMGPGGIMYETADHRWSSMPSASPWGLERLRPWEEWFIGHAGGGHCDQPFRGVGLKASVAY